jgi:large subunit ribosomal protein L18
MAIEAKRVKISARERTKFRIRKKVLGTPERPRLTVFRSSKHIYAQVVSDVAGKTIASASSLDKDVQAAIAKFEVEGKSKSSKSIAAAKVVGMIVAERSKAAKVSAVVFDRNGFVYHGRIQALADGAREGGLQF